MVRHSPNWKGAPTPGNAPHKPGVSGSSVLIAPTWPASSSPPEGPNDASSRLWGSRGSRRAGGVQDGLIIWDGCTYDYYFSPYISELKVPRGASYIVSEYTVTRRRMHGRMGQWCCAIIAWERAHGETCLNCGHSTRPYCTRLYFIHRKCLELEIAGLVGTERAMNRGGS